MQHIANSKNLLKIIYSAGFIFTVHAVLLSYINSSFLGQFVGTDYVGVVFAVAAVFAVLFLNNISGPLSRFGNYKITLFLMVFEMLALVGLGIFKSAALVVIIFAIHYILLTLLRFNFDVFVEHFSADRCTGNIRGTFLTVINLGWLVSPFLAGSILTDSDFWKVYLISAALLIPVFVIIFTNFKKIKDCVYDHPPFWQTLKYVFTNKNVYKIFMSSFLLQFFFAWMIIYTPIYLNQHIGLDWGQIGIIFTIMLLPYVLLEIPLGRIADGWLGEKEFLSAGFVLAGLSTAALSFVSAPSIALWAILLFITRIGATFIEIMSESYFFKQVDDSDVNIISFFRNSRPVSYIIAPLIATGFLLLFPFKYLFIFLALIMLFGLRYSLTLKDTK